MFFLSASPTARTAKTNMGKNFNVPKILKSFLDVAKRAIAVLISKALECPMGTVEAQNAITSARRQVKA